MEFLKSWVLTITSVALFIILLDIILPSGKIKKIIHLISGFIMILTITQPFLGLMGKGLDLKNFQIRESQYIDQVQITKDSQVFKAQQMKQIVEAYRNKLIYQIETSLMGMAQLEDVSVDLIINEDYTSKTFGEIKRVLLNVKIQKAIQGVKVVSKVEKVDLEENSKKNNPQSRASRSAEENKLVENIETEVNQLIGLKREEIVVNILK